MNKITLLLAVLFVFSLSAQAQSTVVVGQGIMPSGSTLPTTCAPTKASDPDSLVLFYHTTTSGGAIGLYQCTATNTWSAAGGGGVSSLTGDGTIITNSASTGAVTLTVAGTSGGIPYFNSTSGWASSGLLATNALVVGGGAGSAPTTGNGDFTYATHTLTAGAAGLVDLSAETSGNGFRVPSASSNCTGSSGTQGAMVQINGQNEFEMCGASTAFFIAVAGVPGTSVATSCTKGQLIQVVAGNAVPTCASLGYAGNTSQKSESGSADGSVLAFTPAASAGMYRVCFDASVSAATSGVIAWTLSWTDSNGNAQSNVQMPLYQQGVAAPALSFTTSAAGNYNNCATIDVNNAAAAITVKWVGGGTTTAKVSATAERLI